jgi:hypothetical protein
VEAVTAGAAFKLDEDQDDDRSSTLISAADIGQSHCQLIQALTSNAEEFS